jgi:hypothetical protein
MPHDRGKTTRGFDRSRLVGVDAMPYAEGVPTSTVKRMRGWGEASHGWQVRAIHAQMPNTIRVQAVGPGATPHLPPVRPAARKTAQ